MKRVDFDLKAFQEGAPYSKTTIRAAMADM